MKTRLILSLIALSASFSHAATYTVTNSAGNNSSVFVNAAGVRLTGNGASSTVVGSAAFGFFSSDTAVTGATSSSELLSGFTQFGTNAGLFNNPTAPTNYQGLFSRSGSVVGAPLDAFTGKNIYAIIGNNASLASATEFAVIKLNALYGAQAAEPITSTFTLDTANTDFIMLMGSKAGPSLTAAGLDSTAEASFQLAVVVPEPSTSLLGVVGALALLRRRRI